MVRKCAVWLIVLVAVAVVGTPAGAEDSPAVQVVHQLHETFGSVLREADTLGYSGRYERLAPAIGQAFDSEFMARVTIGRHWKKLSQEEQQRWVTSFKEYTIVNYAARLDRYTGQSFETLGEKPGQNQTVFVLSRVVDPEGEDIELNYRLRETEAGWRIIDLYAKGTVSELALRRSEYSSVLKQDGFEALVTMLTQKTAEQAATKSSP